MKYVFGRISEDVCYFSGFEDDVGKESKNDGRRNLTGLIKFFIERGIIKVDDEMTVKANVELRV